MNEGGKKRQIERWRLMSEKGGGGKGGAGDWRLYKKGEREENRRWKY